MPDVNDITNIRRGIAGADVISPIKSSRSIFPEIGRFMEKTDSLCSNCIWLVVTKAQRVKGGQRRKHREGKKKKASSSDAIGANMLVSAPKSDSGARFSSLLESNAYPMSISLGQP